MAMGIIDSFGLKAKKPIDTRLVFATKAEMDAYPSSALYKGCLSYCEETTKYYSYNGTSWDEFSGGGGSGTTALWDDGTSTLTLKGISLGQGILVFYDEIVRLSRTMTH